MKAEFYGETAYKWPETSCVTAALAYITYGWVDPRNDGEESVVRLEREYDPLPETVEAVTGGGGRHLLFRLPTGITVKSRPIGSGLDLKAEGGQIIVEPSRHASGYGYAWEVAHHPDEVEIAAAPAWLLDLPQVQERGKSTARVPSFPSSATETTGLGALLLHSTKRIARGTRNMTLTRIAGALRYQGKDGAQIASALLG